MLIIAVIIGAVYAIIFLSQRDKIIVQGEVVDTEFFEYYNGMYTNHYINLTFDNNETYTVFLEEDYYDFTVNSELILYLTKPSYNEYWEISKIVKVPGDDE